MLRGLPPDATARRAALAHAGGALARRIGAFLATSPRDAAGRPLALLVRDAERDAKRDADPNPERHSGHHEERHVEHDAAVPGAGWATRHRH